MGGARWVRPGRNSSLSRRGVGKELQSIYTYSIVSQRGTLFVSVITQLVTPPTSVPQKAG